MERGDCGGFEERSKETDNEVRVGRTHSPARNRRIRIGENDEELNWQRQKRPCKILRESEGENGNFLGKSYRLGIGGGVCVVSVIFFVLSFRK